MKESWGRLPRETAKAYQAFLCYMNLSPRVRTIDRAFRVYQNRDPNDIEVKALPHWRQWATKYLWLKRAVDYDEHVALHDLERWEKRKEQARERDWQQAEELRRIVDGALPHAEQFFRRRVGEPMGGVPTVVNEAGQIIRAGTPAQVIITVAFNVRDLAAVLKDASYLERLVNNEPTDNINNLTGAALDNALRRALQQLALDGDANGGEEGDAEGSPDEDEEPDTEEDVDEGTED